MSIGISFYPAILVTKVLRQDSPPEGRAKCSPADDKNCVSMDEKCNYFMPLLKINL